LGIFSRIPETTEELDESEEGLEAYYQMIHRDDMVNPYWMEENCLLKSEV